MCVKFSLCSYAFHQKEGGYDDVTESAAVVYSFDSRIDSDSSK